MSDNAYFIPDLVTASFILDLITSSLMSDLVTVRLMSDLIIPYLITGNFMTDLSDLYPAPVYTMFMLITTVKSLADCLHIQ